MLWRNELKVTFSEATASPHVVDFPSLPRPPQVVTFILYIKQTGHFTASLFSKLCLLHLRRVFLESRAPSQKQKRVVHVGLALGLFSKPSPGLFSVTLTHLTDGQRSTIYAGRVWRCLRWRGARRRAAFAHTGLQNVCYC